MSFIPLLNRRAVISAPVESKDPFGGLSITYVPMPPVWADLRPAGSDERAAAGTTAGQATYIIHIRYLASVTEKHRITIDGREMNIAGPPLEIGMREYMKITGIQSQ